MSAGYMAPRNFTLAVSSSLRFQFSHASAPAASFEIYRQFGTQDATYRIWTSNFSTKDVPGATTGHIGDNPLSGSNPYYNYWYAEPGGSGSAFTGSATDAPSPYMMHLVDLGSKHMMVEVSSSSGGAFTLYPHLKTGH